MDPDDAPGAGYGQYCPIAHALDVLGERWSLLILRDLLVGTTRFNDLARGLPGLSRSLLTKRLRQFERAGLVEHFRGEYVLTSAGRELEPIVFGLGEWGARWAFGEPDAEELDPDLLVWWMHTRLDTSQLPGKRHVLHLRFSDESKRFWIVIEGGVPSVCLVDPGYEVDVMISSSLRTMYSVWLGRISLERAVRTGEVEFSGPTALTRRMPDVLRLSPVAEMVGAATTEASP